MWYDICYTLNPRDRGWNYEEIDYHYRNSYPGWNWDHHMMMGKPTVTTRTMGWGIAGINLLTKGTDFLHPLL